MRRMNDRPEQELLDTIEKIRKEKFRNCLPISCSGSSEIERDFTENRQEASSA